jgi:PKD repeat protein
MSRRLSSKLLLAVAILGIISCSGVLLAQGRSEEALQRAIAAQEKHTKVLLAIKDVEGTAVGLDKNDQFVVKVYTARPGVTGIPANLENVPVQVVVTGKFVARADPTARFIRPVPIGVSTGHPDITAGTIGCRVTDGSFVYALSNNHVYANQNDASLGDYVIQPGSYDGGLLPDDYLGQLHDFQPIDFSGGNNTIDAAIAMSTTDLLSAATPSDGYGTPGKAIVSAGLGMLVQKYGRTTGWTHGQISGINVTVNVCYESLGQFFCLKQAHFVNQITITPGGFSGGGDSGSLIVTDDNNKNPVGLLFAGSDTMTIANLIGPVLARFGVTVDDGSSQDPVAPVADFQGSPTSGEAPLTVNFTDLSTGNPTSWSWDFDNNGTADASTRNPSHTYNDVGTYTVSLTVTNDLGSDTKTKTDYITVTEQVPVPPVADFSASPTSGDAPLAVNFTDLSTGSPTSWSWDFGDSAGTSTDQNPSYTYSTPGAYTVTLTATNANGSDDEIKADYVNVSSSESLAADFEGSPRSGDAPLTVHFTDLSSGGALSWGWAFGNGDASFARNPSYTYNNPGVYDVTLVISDGFYIDIETKVGYITVTEQTGNPPVAEFSATPTSGEAPLAVRFTDLSTENPTSWSWDFGDGTGTSTLQDPLYTYETPGIYTVSLIATNAYGSNTVTKIDYITVTEQTGNPPVAEFSATPTSGEAPLEIQFVDLSTENPTSWSWDFGDDAGTSTLQDPLYTYETPGIYTVSLIATNTYGSDTVTKVDYITVSGPSAEIILTATGYKVRGRKTADLEWSGATTIGNVNIYRNGSLIATTENDGFYTDATDSRGGGSLTYQVCEVDSGLCSNEVIVYY